MERKTRRCPAACSSPALASWMAGLFSRVVWRTRSRVTAPVEHAKQVMKSMMSSPAVTRFCERRMRQSGEHRLPACRIRPLGECTAKQPCEVAKGVRGKLPRTTGQRPVLRRKRNPRFIAALVYPAGALCRRLVRRCFFQHLHF